MKLVGILGKIQPIDNVWDTEESKVEDLYKVNIK